MGEDAAFADESDVTRNERGKPFRRFERHGEIIQVSVVDPEQRRLDAQGGLDLALVVQIARAIGSEDEDDRQAFRSDAIAQPSRGQAMPLPGVPM